MGPNATSVCGLMLLVYAKVLDWNGGHREGACMLGSAIIRLDELRFEVLLQP